MGSCKAEQAQFVEVAVAPALMVAAAGPAFPSDAFAQEGSEPAPDIRVHRRKHQTPTVLEVPEPPPQQLVEVSLFSSTHVCTRARAHCASSRLRHNTTKSSAYRPSWKPSAAIRWSTGSTH
jgi:hypothetical protein